MSAVTRAGRGGLMVPYFRGPRLHDGHLTRQGEITQHKDPGVSRCIIPYRCPDNRPLMTAA
ncbi:MAG: hypothetical protein WBO37_01075 [Gammaproteobacteria bacterium]